MMSDKQKMKFLRQAFKNACLKRDGNKCCFCNKTEDLTVHHITDRHNVPMGGYVLSNGITLCKEHHWRAEVYHVNKGTHWYVDMHPSDLYEKIGSSYEEAYKDSEELL